MVSDDDTRGLGQQLATALTVGVCRSFCLLREKQYCESNYVGFKLFEHRAGAVITCVVANEASYCKRAGFAGNQGCGLVVAIYLLGSHCIIYVIV